MDNSKINELLNFWCFDKLKYFYLNYNLQDYSLFKSAIEYLYSIGEFKYVNNIIENYSNNFNDNIDYKLTKDKYTFNYKDSLSRHNINLDSINNNNINNSNINNIITNFNLNVSENINLLLIILNFTTKNKIISQEFYINIINLLKKHPNVPDITKKYLIKSILNLYFDSKHADRFFKLPSIFYNHLQSIYYFLIIYTNEDIGAQNLFNKLNYYIKKYNNLKLNSPPKKIAICVSGMLNENKVGLQTIFNNIAKPLDARVFIHCWDDCTIWSGKTRTSTENFLQRLFSKPQPKWITKLFFKKIFPNTFETLSSTITKKIDKSFFDEFRFLDIEIENQTNIKKKYYNNDSFCRIRKNFHTPNMLYSMMKVFNNLKKYEMSNNEKFDYIIRCRPDCCYSLNNSINEIKKKLERLDQNSIYMNFDIDVGPDDNIFIARHEVYETVVSIIKYSIYSNTLSPFQFYPDYTCHDLILLWLIYNNIMPIKLDFMRRDLHTINKNTKIPGLCEALKKDKNEKYITEYNEIYNYLKDNIIQ